MIHGNHSKNWPSRCRPLLDLIRKHKPKSIVEVGIRDGGRSLGLLEETIRHHKQDNVTYTGYALPPNEDPQPELLEKFCEVYGRKVQYQFHDLKDLQEQSADFVLIHGCRMDPNMVEETHEKLKNSGVIAIDGYFSQYSENRGCRKLIQELGDCIVLAPKDTWPDTSTVQMTYRYGQEKFQGVRLSPKGPLIPYMHHEHNCGARLAPRMTERTVELGVADHWLRAVEKGSDPLLIEIGAVTPYYWPKRVPQVVDPSDRKATHRLSLFDRHIDLVGKDVLSISTIEHVGADQYGFRERKNPLDAFRHIADNARRFLVTLPHGWANALVLQKALFSEGYLEKRDVKFFTVTRQPDESWVLSDELLPYGDRHAPWANTLYILERGGLLER